MVEEVCIGILGEEPRSTLTRMSNLASTYWNQGKLVEATELQEKVLEARRRILRDEHPDTLASMNNLASTYCNQGKLAEATELQEKGLEAGRRIIWNEQQYT